MTADPDDVAARAPVWCADCGLPLSPVDPGPKHRDCASVADALGMKNLAKDLHRGSRGSDVAARGERVEDALSEVVVQIAKLVRDPSGASSQLTQALRDAILASQRALAAELRGEMEMRGSALAGGLTELAQDVRRNRAAADRGVRLLDQAASALQLKEAAAGLRLEAMESRLAALEDFMRTRGISLDWREAAGEAQGAAEVPVCGSHKEGEWCALEPDHEGAHDSGAWKWKNTGQPAPAPARDAERTMESLRVTLARIAHEAEGRDTKIAGAWDNVRRLVADAERLRAALADAQKGAGVRVSGKKMDFDYCPSCGGSLDTGWECNDCERDWRPWVILGMPRATDDDALLAERDSAEDCIAQTHRALGGDGEWVAKPGSTCMAGETGDLRIDTPALAEEVVARLGRAEAEVARLTASLLAVAQATGIVYEADGHNPEPGPVEAIVSAIEETCRRRADLEDKLAALAEEHADTMDRLRAAEAVIAQHDLCHNLHGKVDAQAFADGCAAEQRKHYGCAPDRERLAAADATMRNVISNLEQTAKNHPVAAVYQFTCQNAVKALRAHLAAHAGGQEQGSGSSIEEQRGSLAKVAGSSPAPAATTPPRPASAGARYEIEEKPDGAAWLYELRGERRYLIASNPLRANIERIAAALNADAGALALVRDALERWDKGQDVFTDAGQSRIAWAIQTAHAMRALAASAAREGGGV